MRGGHAKEDLEAELKEMADVDLICRYTGCDGKKYLHLVSWEKHQKIDRPSKSRLPRCPEHRSAEDYCGRHEGECGHRESSPSIPTSVPTPREVSTNAREDSRDSQSDSMQDLGSRTLDLGSRTVDHPGTAPEPDAPPARPGSQARTRKTKDIVPAKPPRDDAERLCAHLADRIEANGSKQPVITVKWLDAARLMLDADGRTEEQVHTAIDWCQDDEFWRANILSMPKLREQYDQLRLQAMRESSPRVSRKQQETDDQFERAMERARRREAREAAGNDPH